MMANYMKILKLIQACSGSIEMRMGSYAMEARHLAEEDALKYVGEGVEAEWYHAGEGEWHLVNKSDRMWLNDPQGIRHMILREGQIRIPDEAPEMMTQLVTIDQEKFLTEIESRIKDAEQGMDEAKKHHDLDVYDRWLTKWDALKNVVYLFDECKVEAKTPKAHAVDSLPESIRAEILKESDNSGCPRK